MVKGVSKTIIEVNNTGSKLFEKIVFYVTPEYGNLSAKQLKKAAAAFSFQYDATGGRGQLRKRWRYKRLTALGLMCFGVIFAISVVLLIIL